MCVPLVEEFGELKQTLAEDDELIDFLYRIRIAFNGHVKHQRSQISD